MDPNYIAETPNLSKDWCPVCEPDLDPLKEILSVKYCWAHPPSMIGSADCTVTACEDPGWQNPGEAGGLHGRLFNDMLRGEGWSNR